VPDAEEPFDPIPLLRRFADAGVDFVVIGGVAGGVHGSSLSTYDVDLAYGREPGNLEKLAAVLGSIEAKLRGAPPDVPFLLDAKTLAAGSNFTFTTTMGSVDILGDPAGAPPYEQLRRGATLVDVEGRQIRVASLDHLIAMKEAAGRPKDKLQATEYRTISDELRAPRDG
jgi:hypothetical protein